MSNNKTIFYTRFNRPLSSSIEFKEPSKTQPQFSYESDINNLVRTVVDKNGVQHSVMTGVTSSLPFSSAVPSYGDFTQYTSEKLLAAKNLVTQAQSQFEQLPSYIRERFSNNPVKLIDFLNDSSNYDEALKLGLISKKELSDVVSNVNSSPDKVTSDEAT